MGRRNDADLTVKGVYRRLEQQTARPRRGAGNGVGPPTRDDYTFQLVPGIPRVAGLLWARWSPRSRRAVEVIGVAFGILLPLAAIRRTGCSTRVVDRVVEGARNTPARSRSTCLFRWLARLFVDSFRHSDRIAFNNAGYLGNLPGGFCARCRPADARGALAA